MKAWLKEVLGPPKQELTTTRLHQLANDLTRASEGHSKSEGVVESVRQIAELMIWGDRHNPSFFDVFLERDILGSILVLLKARHTPKAVKIQIIQTLSMMISNTQNETSVYFILSNNRVNELIQHDFDFTDIDYISYYISFVKALSLKLNNDTVQFFFNNPKQQFVLYTEAIRHFKHPESMVRIAVRTLTLQVFSVEDERMRAFVLKHATSEYLVAVIDNSIDVVQNLGIECANATSQSSQAKLDSRIEELLDMLHYLSDVILIPWPELQDACRTMISEQFIKPLLQATVPGLGDMLSSDVGNTSIHLSADLVYFVLIQMCRAINDTQVLEECTKAVLSFESQQQGTDQATNVYREELLGHLNHKDEELVLPALCLIQVLVSHRNMSHQLLASVNLLPRRFHNEQSQLAMLTEGFESPPPGAVQDGWQPSSAQKLLAAVRDRACSDSPPSRALKSPKSKGNAAKALSKAERIAAERQLMQQIETPPAGSAAEAEADPPAEEVEASAAEAEAEAEAAAAAEAEDLRASVDAEEEEKKRKLKLERMENERKLMTEGPGKSREVGGDMSKAERMEAERAIMRTGAMPQAELRRGGNGELKFEVEPEPERHYSATELAAMTKEERMAAERHLMQYGKLPPGTDLNDLVQAMDDPLQSDVLPSPHSPNSTDSGQIEEYPGVVVEKLLQLLCRYPTCRTVTIQVAAALVLNLVQTQVPSNSHQLLHRKHWNMAQRCYSLARSFLRNRVYGTMANVLLDMFENEVKADEAAILVDQSRQNMMMIQMMRGGFLLLPASSTSSSSLELSMRLPRNELEITRKAIQVFLLIRRLIHELQGQVDTSLPLKRVTNSFEVDSPIDLSDQDVIACGVKTNSQMRPVSRYIVISQAFLVIVEPDPDPKKMSWAFVRVVHPLQYVEAKATRADPRILQVAMRKNQKQEVMHLVFDDQRRCVSARQHFERGREFVQKSMMEQINSLLWPEDMPASNATTL